MFGTVYGINTFPFWKIHSICRVVFALCLHVSVDVVSWARLISLSFDDFSITKTRNESASWYYVECMSDKCSEALWRMMTSVVDAGLFYVLYASDAKVNISLLYK